MVVEEVGQDTLRAENIDRLVKGFALQKFVMKQLVMTPKSTSWQESYYRETAVELSAVSNIPRMARFPAGFHTWEKFSSYMKKAGLETEISWEDGISDNIDVIARSLLRVSRAVVKSVDDTIWNAISENQSATNIQTLATSAAWDNPTRANRIPHEDIAEAASKIAEQNYQADFILLSPKDFLFVVTNDYVMDSFDASGPALMQNGKLGRLLGLDVVVSNSVTADYALVGQKKICGTYRIAEALKTHTEIEPGIKWVIRAWEIGTAFVTDPKALCLLTNTQA